MSQWVQPIKYCSASKPQSYDDNNGDKTAPTTVTESAEADFHHGYLVIQNVIPSQYMIALDSLK